MAGAAGGGGQRSLLVGMELLCVCVPPSPPALVLHSRMQISALSFGDLSFIKACPGDVTRISGGGASRSLHCGRRRPASPSVLALGATAAHLGIVGAGGIAVVSRHPLRHQVHSSPHVNSVPWVLVISARCEVRWFYVMGHGRVLGNQSRAWGPELDKVS